MFLHCLNDSFVGQILIKNYLASSSDSMFVFLSIATLGCAALLYNLSSSSCYHYVGEDYDEKLSVITCARKLFRFLGKGGLSK